MNFISHFYLEYEHKENAYLIVGLSIPDLWHAQMNLYAPKPEMHDEIEKHHFKIGLQKHFLSDKVFHNSDYFLSTCDWANEEIKKHSFFEKVKRKFFLVHISVEIVIDVVLIRLYPHLVEEFYNSFSQVNADKVQKFMEQIYCYNFEGLSNKIRRFREEKRIYEYLEREKLVMLLDFMMQSITRNSCFSERDKTDGIYFLELLEAKIQSNHELLFREMYSKMNYSPLN
ncbi:MAG: hypothetical protein NZ455_00665 [Bacteroidia bacterium]|nr:hypothetical protein [Bacteroidia bacterium]MDW8345418.1 hypothetical protein [Bacteroidia bacterium]